MTHANITILTGFVKKIYPIFTTPNGVNVSRFVLEHRSTQNENNISREIAFNMFCVKVGGELDHQYLDSYIEVCGFIHLNRQKQLVLHVNKITKLN